MSGLLAAPECECGCRQTTFRFDTDDDIGLIACADCKAVLFVVSVLANERVSAIKDPMAGELPEGVYYNLEQAGRLPPSVTDSDE